MTRICALNGRKLILAKTVPCAVESFTAYTCSSLLSSIDTHFTVVVAVTYSLRCGQTATPFGKTGGTYGARFQTTSTSLVRNNQLPIFFALVVVHKFTHEVRRIKVVVVLSFFLTSWVSVWSATSAKKSEAQLFLSDLGYDVIVIWNL